MTFIRKIRRGGSVYYAEVESVRIGKKIVQRHVRYIGKTVDALNSLPLDTIHFGYIAARLMQGDLTAHELIGMVEKMGHRVPIEDLEAIGIRHDFKKNDTRLSLYPARISEMQSTAQNAERDSRSKRRTIGRRKHYREKVGSPSR